jgi:hypothetical protein
MGGKNSVGVFHEKRGNDHFTVHKTLDGDVIEVEQYDANAAFSHTRSVDFFTESAPALIKLIQKAAGIKPEKVEYEYMVLKEFSPIGTQNKGGWSTKEEAEDALKLLGAEGHDPVWGGWKSKLVKRVKAGQVQDA